MSITKLRTKKQAWIKFLEQWLVENTGQGYAEYRRVLKQKGGLDVLIIEWRMFVQAQYNDGWFSDSQYEKYTKSLPRALINLVTVRMSRGEPTGLPSGCPLFVKGNEFWKRNRLSYIRESDIKQNKNEDTKK